MIATDGARWCHTSIPRRSDALSGRNPSRPMSVNVSRPRVTGSLAGQEPLRVECGYITDIGLPPPYAPIDFAAWIEVYLGGRWHSFDPRKLPMCL
jgi:hypothetical protein